MGKVYNIRESSTNKLFHAFKTKKTKSGECHDEALVSICGEVNINNASVIYLSCVTEKRLKIEYKKNERQVCEKCIATINNS